MLIVIKVQDEPDFQPHQIEVDALPPQGLLVEIDRRMFTVQELTLRSSEHPTGRRSYYEAWLSITTQGLTIHRIEDEQP